MPEVRRRDDRALEGSVSTDPDLARVERVLRSRLLGDPLEPTRLGRYRVLSRLGAGAMGVVYGGHDDRLDRKVAIKLLHRRLDREAGHDRLGREARALARLSHANVVRVFEIGEQGGRRFVVMEHIEGRTLRAWLDEAPRSVPDICAAYEQAGLGLAAAHAAGLVHRDFKPDNALVDVSGRVRVVDFGLVGLGPTITPHEESTPDSSGADVLETPLTLAGTKLGTPAYMAAEQIEGAPLGAGTDQFAFCVAMWEALVGARPFAGERVDDLFARVRQGDISPPPAGRMSRRIEAALRRGLAVDPAARWPDMHALLAEVGSTRSTRPPARVVMGVSALFTGIVAAAWIATPATVHECETIDRRLADVWNDGRRAEAERAVMATGRQSASEVWKRIVSDLDDYAAAVAQVRAEACAATDEPLFDARIDCLGERLRSLRVVVDALATTTSASFDSTVMAARTLPPVDRCGEASYLQGLPSPPTDPAVRAEVEAIRDRLADAFAMAEAGHAQAAAIEVRDEEWRAREIGYSPLVAEAALVAGQIHVRSHQRAEAESKLQEAYFDARAMNDAATACEAAGELVLAVGADPFRYEEALTWGRHAMAELGPSDDGTERADISNHLGTAASIAGRFEEAIVQFESTVRLREEALGPEHLVTAAGYLNLAVPLVTVGRYAEALEAEHRGLAIVVEQAGADHRLAIIARSNIGDTLRSLGRNEESRQYLREALALGRTALEPLDEQIGLTLGSLALTEASLGDTDIASVLVREAIALFQALDTEHHQLVAEWSDLAMIEGLAGRFEDALKASDRALAVSEAVLGPVHPNLAVVLNNRGATLMDLRRFEEAVADFERANAIQVSTFSADHPMIASTIANIGVARRELGQLDVALEILASSTRVLHDSVGMRHEFTIRGVFELATTSERVGRAAIDEHAAPWLERLIASADVDEETRARARARLEDLRRG